MKFVLLLLLLSGEVREYFPVSLQQLATGKNYHTHVRVAGVVKLVSHEGDGDLHIKVVDGSYFIVAECIPEIPCKRPRYGQKVIIEGISRFDGEHKWYEVHPVEKLYLVK